MSRDVRVSATTVAPKRPIPADDVQLTLSPDVAESLLMVCNLVGGPASSRRGEIDKIGNALRQLGFGYSTNAFRGVIDVRDDGV